MWARDEQVLKKKNTKKTTQCGEGYESLMNNIKKSVALDRREIKIKMNM